MLRTPWLGRLAAIALLSSSAPLLANEVWVALGPEGGQVTSVAIDPGNGNTVYAGTPVAGVFRSTNGGRLWQRAGLDGGAPVQSLRVAPGTHAVFATQEEELYRSFDGGASWTRLSDRLAATGVQPQVFSLALPPSPGAVYVVAFGNQGLVVLESTDSGDSWTAVWSQPAGVFFIHLFADPSQARTLFAATNLGVYTSTDGGATWSLGGLRAAASDLAVEHGPGQRLLAAVPTGDPRLPRTDLYVSADLGRTWQLRNRLNLQPLARVLADPTSPGAFYAVGLFGDLHRTTDVGRHWTSVGSLPNHLYDLSFDPTRPGVGFTAVEGSRFGRSLWKTASYGAVWTPFLHGLLAADFETVTSDPTDPQTLWAGAGAPGGSADGISPLGLWKSPDRGQTWTLAAFPTVSIPTLVFTRPAATPQRFFVGTLGRGLEESDDAGLHWSHLPLQTSFVYDLESPAQEPNTLYALDDHGNFSSLDLSLDGGATWTTQPVQPEATTLAFSPVSASTLYANGPSGSGIPGVQDLVRRSLDRGATWTTLLTLLGGTVHAIVVDPADPLRIAVGFEQSVAGEVHGSVFRSVDGGITWSSADLSPDRPGVWSLLADPLVPHGLLAGTRTGVYASPDSGATWAPLGEGLPKVTVAHLHAAPTRPDILYIATAGAGLYRLERTVP
jgi:photosystem II stability/assembly factor-like uncharacterized protein